mgnify:CR=1 FL=1
MVGKVLVVIGAFVGLTGLLIAATGSAERVPLGIAVMGMGTAPIFVGTGLLVVRRFTPPESVPPVAEPAGPDVGPDARPDA